MCLLEDFWSCSTAPRKCKSIQQDCVGFSLHGKVHLMLQSIILTMHFFQGYLIYTVKQKLKQKFIGLSGGEIKQLKLSGVEVCIGLLNITNLKIIKCSQVLCKN
jgi:hypothetical protein